MKNKSTGQYYFVPQTASFGIADRDVSYEELIDIICNLSFDNPKGRVSYSIEVTPQGVESTKKF